MKMASYGQAFSHSRQPVQFFSITLTTPRKLFGSFTCTISRASNGHRSTHFSQPVHACSYTKASGRSFFFSMCCTLPYWSRMASTGQTGPQAPQSMHRSGQMMCSPLRSPVIASVGQRFTHAVQPMQVSMMRKAMDRPLYRQWVQYPRHADDPHVRPHRGRARGASSAAPYGERTRVAEQAVPIVRIVVAADATHAVHQDQPLAVQDVERRHAGVGILARHLGHRGVEAPDHRPLHFPLVAGDRPPEAGARAEGPGVLPELLRRVPL